MGVDRRERKRASVLATLVFVCGWAVMSLEILGGRILTPFFGSDIYVWGSVISVFLMSLAIGYFLGGKLSKRFTRPVYLCGVILIAAVSIMVLTQVHERVNGAVFDLLVTETGGERWACLLAATSLFLLPTTLLGMVSPYAVRLAAREVSSVGEKAGTLYAISTVGSVLGCLMTSFYFILWFHMNTILFLTGGMLVAVVAFFAGLYEPDGGRKRGEVT